ncbi:MAG: cell envelope integrity protein TolA [Parvibaculaceae bacterium]
MTLKIDTGDRPLEPIAPAGKAGRWCLPASFCAHAAALALMAGMVGHPTLLKGENEVPVDVDIITVSEWTSPDSSPSTGQNGGEDVSEVKPLEVTETKFVEMATLDPVEEIEPLALEAADSPKATELDAADAPEETMETKTLEAKQPPAQVEPVPAANVKEPKQALPVLATRSETQESISASEEVAGKDAETAVPSELKAEETPEASPTKLAEITPKVEPKELVPVPEKAEAEEKQEPARKPTKKEKREQKKETKERKEIKATKTAEKAREGKTRKKAEAALAKGTDSEASTAKRSRSSGSASMNNYRGLIAARLQRHKRYPEEAKRKGAKGIVRVSFTINRSGQVTRSQIVGSSGELSLDKEVRAMLSRAAPFPPLPDDMGSSLSITVPISFSLVN